MLIVVTTMIHSPGEIPKILVVQISGRCCVFYFIMSLQCTYYTESSGGGEFYFIVTMCTLIERVSLSRLKPFFPLD